MDIVIYPNKMLSTAAKIVENIDDALQNLIDDMIKTMVERNALGLAAPQVGESKRLIVYSHGDSPMVLINPVVNKIGTEFCSQEEACLSVPNFQVHVVRASKVMVTGLDRGGIKQKFVAESMLARIIQHEVDHLDGKLFIDRIDPLKRLNYNRELQRTMRERGY